MWLRARSLNTLFKLLMWPWLFRLFSIHDFKVGGLSEIRLQSAASEKQKAAARGCCPVKPFLGVVRR